MMTSKKERCRGMTSFKPLNNKFQIIVFSYFYFKFNYSINSLLVSYFANIYILYLYRNIENKTNICILYAIVKYMFISIFCPRLQLAMCRLSR